MLWYYICRDGHDVEGASHEDLCKLLSSSKDEVEMILVTPGEAKMLDIPSSVVIHRSDGATTSISKSSLLLTATIDEALQKELVRLEQPEQVLALCFVKCILNIMMLDVFQVQKC